MMSFNKGDKVRVIKLNDEYEHLKEFLYEIAEVLWVDSSIPFPVFLEFEDGSRMFFEFDELELVKGEES